MHNSLLNRNNGNNKKRKVITTITVLVLLGAVYIFGNGISRTMSGFTHGMFASVLKTGETTKNTMSLVPSFFSSRILLENENKILKEKVQELEIKSLVSEYIRNENDELRGILNRLDERDVTLATIISRPNQSLYDTLIIDVGNNKLINEGDTIVANGNIIIGRIAEVYEKSSKVVLFSSFGEEMTALIGKHNISATAIGRNSGNFEIQFPRDTDITVGDMVSAPSMNIEILGTVSHIQKEANDPFQVVLIKSPINMYEIKFVEVIKNYKDVVDEDEE